MICYAHLHHVQPDAQYLLRYISLCLVGHVPSLCHRLQTYLQNCLDPYYKKTKAFLHAPRSKILFLSDLNRRIFVEVHIPLTTTSRMAKSSLSF